MPQEPTIPTKMFDDLMAVQKELPSLQKSAINPHFGSKYIPLEELISQLLPVLNKHNFVLLQQPTTLNGEPALKYGLHHKTGEKIENTMPLLLAKNDPQAQGSAITYARRYSVMSMLGLVADQDDDGNKASGTGTTGTNAPAPAKAAPKASPDKPPSDAQKQLITKLSTKVPETERSDFLMGAIGKTKVESSADASKLIAALLTVKDEGESKDA